MNTTLDESIEGNWLCVEQFLMGLIRKTSYQKEVNESELKRANAQAIIEAIHSIEKLLRRKYGHGDRPLSYKSTEEIMMGVLRCKNQLFDELLLMQSMEQSTTLLSLAAAIEYIFTSVTKMSEIETNSPRVIAEYNNTRNRY